MPKKHTEPQRQTPSTRENLSESVTFRLEPHNHSLLLQKAAADKIGPNLWARRALLDVLTEEDAEREREERLTALEEGLLSLRRSLAMATEAILLAVLTKEPMSPDQVKQWVAANLRPEPD